LCNSCNINQEGGGDDRKPTSWRPAERGVKAGDINGFLDVSAQAVQSVPLVGSSASCGFPSPADDYLDRPLDFNELPIVNAAATFAVRIAGESMIGVGMFPNDIAVVDRSVEASNGCIASFAGW
jgi:DNA polymerase V